MIDRLRGLPRDVWLIGLFSLANSSNLFLLLRARELGLPPAQIPLLWAAISAVAMVGSSPLAAWSDRIGRRQLLIWGYGGYGLLYLLIGQLHRSGAWLIFGWLYEHFSPTLAFTASGICAKAAGVWLSRLSLVPGSARSCPARDQEEQL